jgi:hypothetical protein
VAVFRSALVEPVDVAPVVVTLRPGWRQHELVDPIDAEHHVLNAQLPRHLHDGRRDRVVAWNLGVGRRGLQERELQVSELLPVEYLGVKVEAEALDGLLDVVDRGLAVPPVVEVHRHAAKAVPLAQQCNVRAVDAAADANHRVVGLALPVLANGLDAGTQTPFTLLR